MIGSTEWTRSFGRRARSRVRTEWHGAIRDIAFAARTRKLRAVPLTLGSCLLILALQAVQHSGDVGHRWVDRVGGVYATLPWWTSLLRTPLSLFVPDPSLPVWGLTVQVMVVFALAELTVGRRHTLGIGLLATLTGTVFARCSLAFGPGSPIGLPHGMLSVRDTGPSAAVVALGVYVACRYGAWWTAGTVVAAMVAEVLCVANLAGFEHLAAIAAVLLLYGVEGLLRYRREARDARPGRGRAGRGRGGRPELRSPHREDRGHGSGDQEAAAAPPPEYAEPA